MKPFGADRSAMPRRLGLAILLAAGLATTAAAQNPSRFDGQYVGDLTLTRLVSGDCTQPPQGARYPLTVSGGEVRFKYVPRFDTTLKGKVDANGDFHAAAKVRSGFVLMTGHIAGNDATAEITSPSCNYTFSTKR